MADYPSDHVLLANAQKFIVGLLKQAGVHDELLPAWEEFYRRYDPLIRRFARACGTAEKDLDDAAQAAWTVFIPVFPDFVCDPRKGSFRAWLFKRVRSSAVATLRHEAANPVCTTGFDFANILGISPEPHCVWEQRWNEQVIEEALAILALRLNKVSYYLFMMRHYHGTSVLELAEETGIDRAEIRARIFRAKREFVQILDTGGYRDLLFPG